MDPLKPSSQLAASLRALRLARTGAAAEPPKPEQGGTASVEPSATLRERLVDLVAGVDPTDPDAVRRARKPAISAILLHEFGESAMADPRFDEMVAAVDAALAPRADGADPFLDLLHALTGKTPP